MPGLLAVAPGDVPLNVLLLAGLAIAGATLLLIISLRLLTHPKRRVT